ncbi:MAG: hypothetical protein LCI03_00980 [Actinobacteria bacterium]|nr:hypothetical protein [Actinomycetota bacterium]
MSSETGGPRDFLPHLTITLDPFSPIPICLPTLSPEETTAHLEDLADWVAWVTRRYALDHRTIPPCWAEHGALQEELSALRTGWITAYSPDALGDAPLRWHGEFDAARHRLATWVARTGCRASEHRDDL